MKKISIVSLVALMLSLAAPQIASAAGGSGGPKFDEAMIRLFGDNKVFTADIEGSSNDPQAQGMVMTGRLCVSEGMARADFSITVGKGGDQSMVAQMKMMGMGSFASITRPDKKTSYLLYPELKSYVEMPDGAEDESETEAPGESVSITEIGKETIDGHACVKNRVVITMKDKTTEESIVWNAKDLRNFPLRIQSVDGSFTMTLNFRNVSFSKPDSSLFNVPSGFTRYTTMQAMMQAEMMKRMSSMQQMGAEDSE